MLRELCDHSVAPWPDGWRDNFAPYDFFYVVGVREYFTSRGIAQIGSILSELDLYPPREGEESPLEWRSFLTGGDVSEANWKPSDYGLDELGAGVKRRMVGGGLGSFSKATLIAASFSRYLAASTQPTLMKDLIQIRFAGHYIPGFEVFYGLMSAVEQVRLARETGQQSASVFVQMTQGYPVTHSLANTTKTFLNTCRFAREEVSLAIDIESYATRDHLRSRVLDLRGGNDVKDTMVAARSERVFL